MVICGNTLNTEQCCPESLLLQTDQKKCKKQYQSNSLLMPHLNSTIFETEVKKNKNNPSYRLISLLCTTSKLPERIFRKRPQHCGSSMHTAARTRLSSQILHLSSSPDKMDHTFTSWIQAQQANVEVTSRQ
jgi:hypothetical protein